MRAPGNRARASAGLFVYAYVGFSLPVIASGALADLFGLLPAMTIFSTLQISITAITVMLWARRSSLQRSEIARQPSGQETRRPSCGTTEESLIMKDKDSYRGLGWAHGALTVQRLGAMLAPVTFLLADGRQVAPLHIAPWAQEAQAQALPGILRKMRGEWPCVPFGYSVAADGWPQNWSRVMTAPEPDEEIHGHCSNHDWNWCQSDSHGDSDSQSLSLALTYPATSPIVRVERTVAPDPAAPAIDITFKIIVRRACRLPIGLHPVFRLPEKTGAATLELGGFDHGHTYPHDVEPGASVFAANQTFTDLARIPARSGGVLDASQLPLAADTEELLQLSGLDGTAALANHAEGYRVRLSWQKEHFPSLLLWYSNRGRKAAPWDGRHVAVGIEPICSPFGLGPASALADNPIAQSGIATALEFVPEKPFVTRYRIEASAL